MQLNLHHKFTAYISTKKSVLWILKIDITFFFLAIIL